MEKCGAAGRDGCTQTVTWKQDVFAGAGDQGRFVYHAYWCDEHAARITEKRRIEWGVPPTMTPVTSPPDA